MTEEGTRVFVPMNWDGINGILPPVELTFASDTRIGLELVVNILIQSTSLLLTQIKFDGNLMKN